MDSEREQERRELEMRAVALGQCLEIERSKVRSEREEQNQQKKDHIQMGYKNQQKRPIQMGIKTSKKRRLLQDSNLFNEFPQ